MSHEMRTKLLTCLFWMLFPSIGGLSTLQTVDDVTRDDLRLLRQTHALVRRPDVWKVDDEIIGRTSNLVSSLVQRASRLQRGSGSSQLNLSAQTFVSEVKSVRERVEAQLGKDLQSVVDTQKPETVIVTTSDTPRKAECIAVSHSELLRRRALEHEAASKTLLSDARVRPKSTTEKEEEVEEEQLEELEQEIQRVADLMAEFKELQKKRQEMIEASNLQLDDTLDAVVANMPKFVDMRKNVEDLMANFRRQGALKFYASIFNYVYLVIVTWLLMKKYS